MNSITMQTTVQSNEMNQQLSNGVSTATNANTNNTPGKRNFTAAQMWYRQRNVRSASRLHRRIAK